MNRGDDGYGVTSLRIKKHAKNIVHCVQLGQDVMFYVKEQVKYRVHSVMKFLTSCEVLHEEMLKQCCEKCDGA